MSSGAYTLRLARTLYNEVYRAMLYNENQQPIAKLRIVPNIPLDRSQVPEDAPVVPAFLLVIVDDLADFPVGVGPHNGIVNAVDPVQGILDNGGRDGDGGECLDAVQIAGYGLGRKG